MRKYLGYNLENTLIVFKFSNAKKLNLCISTFNNYHTILSK